MPERDWFEAYALPDRSTPRVRANFVTSIDGAGTLGGRSGALGNATDQRIMHVLRSLADVIVVGAGTIRAEGYGGAALDETDAAWRRDHGLPDQPPFAIVSSQLDIDPRHPFFAEAITRPLVVTHATSPAARREALAEVADVLVCGDEAVDPSAVVAAFADRGQPQILTEGGPRLAGDFAAAGHLDEFCVTLSPTVAGGDAGRIVRGAPEADRRMRLVHAIPDDDYVFLRYAR